MAEPLNDSEWSRFWSLLASPARSQEMHDELAELHAKAQTYIDEWKPDAKAVAAHVVAAFQNISNLIERLHEILPAAGGMVGSIANMKAMVENVSVALKGPANIPPMPDPPMGAVPEETWPIVEPQSVVAAEHPDDIPKADSTGATVTRIVSNEQFENVTVTTEAEPIVPPTDGAPVSSGGAEAPQPDHS